MKACLTTGIGSLPFTSVDEAIRHIWESYDIPFVPELLGLGSTEGMIEGGRRKGVPSAYPSFIKRLESERSSNIVSGIVKVQVTGPETLSLHSSGEGEFSQHIIEKLKRYVRDLRGYELLIIFDEPVLSPSNVKETLHQLNAIVETLAGEAGSQKMVYGIHSCNVWTEAMFSEIFASRLSLISFDIQYGLPVMTRMPELFDFLQRGWVMWGVVPTTQENLSGASASNFIQQFVKEGLKKREIASILSRSVFSPACGTGTLGIEREKNIAKTLKKFSFTCREYLTKEKADGT